MRVLHVCDTVIGGTGSYLSELLLAQDQSDTGLDLFLLIPAQHRAYLAPEFATSNVHILTFFRMNRWIGMFVMAFAYAKAWFQLRPDIVHAHSFGAGLVTRLLPAGRSKLIYCPHGWSFNMKVAPLVQSGLALLEKLLSLHTDGIILISRHEVESAILRGIPKGKMWRVVSGIHPAEPSAPAASWADNRLKLLFLGRFDRQKGLDLLIEAVDPLQYRVCLRAIGAAVVGEGTDMVMPATFVEPIGWQDREGVASHMKACDAVVVPSRWEGFGLVAIEAMRLGKPVIASAVGGLRETLGNGRYGFCIPADNALALQYKIKELTSAELADMSERGRRRFLDFYTSDRMIKQTFDVYRSVAFPAGRRSHLIRRARAADHPLPAARPVRDRRLPFPFQRRSDTLSRARF